MVTVRPCMHPCMRAGLRQLGEGHRQRRSARLMSPDLHAPPPHTPLSHALALTSTHTPYFLQHDARGPRHGPLFL